MLHVRATPSSPTHKFILTELLSTTMSMDVQLRLAGRAKLSVYLLGLEDSGQNILKDHWLDSATAVVLSNIADVKFMVENDLKAVLPPHTEVQSSVFLVHYSPSRKESIEYANNCVKTLLSAFTKQHPKLFVIESTDIKRIEESETGKKFPEVFAQYTLLRIFHVDVHFPATLVPVFKETILNSLFDDADVDQIIKNACVSGQPDVLKLFLTHGRSLDESKWLKDVLESLDQLSCTDKLVPNLLATAELIYNLEPAKSFAFVRSSVSMFPRSSLMVLNRFKNIFNKNPQVLALPDSDLHELSPKSIAEVRYTHLSLPSNGLMDIPEEMFQLQSLLTLNLSNNKLSKIPPIIRWNCPKLQQLDLSHNQLVDVPLTLFKAGNQGKRISMHAGVSNETHAAPQRMVLRLTGQNLYSCIHSLMNVDISHNPALTRVPEWVCVLPHIALLNLRGLLKLTTLPQELGYWESLSIIQLEPEKMISPPAKVCAHRSQAILAYLKCQLKGSTHYRHMRIMLLGGNKSGKTTIFNGLVSNSGKQQLQSTSTNTYDFRGEVSNGQHLKISYHLMDYSNRAMEYLVYQCFLVKRCVYVVSLNAQDGKEGLEKLLPFLKNLHSCLSEARVLLVVTHVDKVPTLSLPDVLNWTKEAFLIEHPMSLSNPEYAHQCGLPLITRPVLLNALESSDIEGLKREIHWVAGDMMEYSPQPRTEEMIPRLYNLLQGVVENRLKRNRNQPNILKYEELFDSFKSMSGELKDEEKEFNLACGFLEDCGAIVIQPMSGSSDLYFLDTQWLLDTISKSLYLLPSEIGKSGMTVSKPELVAGIQSSGTPVQFTGGLLQLLEDKKLIIALDLEKSNYLLLHLLPPLPPKDYRACNPHIPNTLVRVTSSKSLPTGLFPCLQSQIITSLYRLGAQLMVLSNTKEQSAPEDPFANFSGVDSIKSGKSFTLSRSGYVENTNRKDLEDGEDRMKRIRMMSFSSPVDKIHQDLTHVKLSSLSDEAFPKSRKFASNQAHNSSWISDGIFWQGVVWRSGLYMEYGDGTLAWIEGGASTITVATQGNELACIKALMFLTSCLHSVLEDKFPYFQTTSLIPCSQCISNNLATGGSQNIEELLKNVYLYTASELLSSHVNATDKPVCGKCSVEAVLEEVSPEIMLLDFNSPYRLKQDAVQFTKDTISLLGQGKYAVVFSGSYDNKDVVVKIYQCYENNLMKYFNSLRSELNILTSLSHPHLVSPVGALLRPMALVFPLAPLGSLHDHIQLCPSGLDDQISHKLLYQIADGLRYLHSLYIIHRDIKPSNILVWSLDPSHRVLIKISDCGFSQFNAPNGHQLGTEDFMAPELFTTGRKLFYDEKVDIFSFGIILYSIVSGKSIIPGTLFKADSQITNLTLSLGQAITSSMEEQRPRDNVSSAATSILNKEGVHPASRQGLVTMCVAKCLQSLLRDCLWKDPSRRPSAEGICSHLLLCTAPSTQERIIIQQNYSIVSAVEVPSINSVIAWGNHGNQIMMVVKDEWSVKPLFPQLPEAFTRTKNVMGVAKSTMYIASCKSRTLQSFHLLNSSHTVEAPKNCLPSNPCCIFTSVDGNQIYVGMEGGRVAMFTAAAEGKSPLEATPLVGKALEHPDRRKTPVRCGVVTNDTVLCGCGRYLIGLDCQNLQQKFFKPLTDQGTMISGIANSGNRLWVWFADCGEIIICDTVTGNRVDSIDFRVCLHSSVPDASEILITTISPANPTVWVGTNTGHVMGYKHDTLELQVAVQHHSCVESIVTIGSVMLVFGKWAFEADSTMEGFAVWRSHL